MVVEKGCSYIVSGVVWGIRGFKKSTVVEGFRGFRGFKRFSVVVEGFTKFQGLYKF